MTKFIAWIGWLFIVSVSIPQVIQILKTKKEGMMKMHKDCKNYNENKSWCKLKDKFVAPTGEACPEFKEKD